MFRLIIGWILMLYSPIALSYRNESYIIGGTPVTPPNKWPWVAALMLRGEYQCGGTLITQTHVLTSAYCVDISSVIRGWVAVLGTSNLLTSEGAQMIRIRSIMRHDRYGEAPGLNANDIAIFTLRTPAVFNSRVNVIQVAERDIRSSNCYFAGWGRMEASRENSIILHDRSASIIPYNQCRNFWQTNVNRLVHTCSIGATPCMDTGAPLMCPVGNAWYLLGLASWGAPDCVDGLPYVSTRIPYYTDWIYEIIGGRPFPPTQPPPTGRCSNVTSVYSISVIRIPSIDQVWCNMGQTGTLTLTEGEGGTSHTCTYAWRTDDGQYMIEIQCDGYVTRKVTFTLASAKAEALCSAKHSLMARGPNKPVDNTVAACDASPANSTEPDVTIRCIE